MYLQSWFLILEENCLISDNLEKHVYALCCCTKRIFLWLRDGELSFPRKLPHVVQETSLSSWSSISRQSKSEAQSGKHSFTLPFLSGERLEPSQRKWQYQSSMRPLGLLQIWHALCGAQPLCFELFMHLDPAYPTLPGSALGQERWSGMWEQSTAGRPEMRLKGKSCTLTT